jgi:hypothetical protein
MHESPKVLIHEVVEEVKSLEHEAAEGTTARTPALVLGGIAAAVWAVVAVLLIFAFTAYYLTK